MSKKIKPKNNINNNNSNKNKSSRNKKNFEQTFKTSFFNSIAHECVDPREFESKKKNASGTYNTNEEYQASFDKNISGNTIFDFSKKYSDVDKKNIDYVLYHRNNADGMTAAFIFWKFITNDGKDRTHTQIQFLGVDPGFQSGNSINPRFQPVLKKIKGKKVLMMDVAINLATLQAINQVADNLIVIDDHKTTANSVKNGEMPNVFAKEGEHAACAFVYKFLFPNNDVPIWIQYIDANDSKLFLPYLAYTDLFTLAFAVRVTNNVRISNEFKNKMYGGVFDMMNEMFDDDKKPNFLIFIGNYMNEIRENMKFELANLAVPAKFQGYNVGVLNYDSPGLAKVVGRQIVTNFQNRGQPIDFSVLWSYQYIKDAYRVQLINDHKPNSIDVGAIVNKLTRLPQVSSGGGHKNIGNFYWKGDIHDLFKKKMI